MAMRDYDELIKRLRICPDYNEGCVNCLHEHDLGCRTTTMREAADAIEELSNIIEQYKMYLQDALNDLKAAHEKEPKWIFVADKENLPNTDSGVVGYFGGGAFDQLRWYDFVITLSDGTIVGENTERDVMSEHCIAVYKLPESPKEKI